MDASAGPGPGPAPNWTSAVVARPLAPRGGPLMRLLLPPPPGEPVLGPPYHLTDPAAAGLPAGNGSGCGPAEALPSIYDYYTAMNVAGASLFSAGALAVLATLLLYADSLRRALPRGPPLAKAPTAFVLAVYPVVAVASYCAVIVPRAQLLAEAVTQGAFTAAMYQLFCLLLAYVGGEAEAVRLVKRGALDPRVRPCCCWPCCRCLPTLDVTKRGVRHLRLLVLQLPLVQGLLYTVLLVMWAEEESLYQVNYMYLQPVVVVSILTGIWGLSMTMRALEEPLAGRRAPAKFLALQAVLLMAKAQGLVARVLVWAGVLPCRPPISPAVYAYLVYNAGMLAEMVVLSLVARRLYASGTSEPGPGPPPPPRQVYVVGDKLKALTPATPIERAASTAA